MKKLIIERLKIDGEYSFDKEFSDGLYILTGTDNSCGKSLFVHLIDFALGDDGRDLIDYNILKQCTYLYADIRINDEIFAIRRNLNIIGKDIDVFKGLRVKDIFTSPDIASETIAIEDYQKDIFKKLTGYDYIPTVAPKSGNKKTISFAFFSNLFYLNQGVQAGQIFRYQDIIFPEHIKEKIFSLYLNTNKIKKSFPEIERQQLKEKSEESLTKLNIERQFFSSNFSDNNYFAEKEKHDRIINEINILNYRLLDLDKNINSLEIMSNVEQQQLIDKNRQLRKLLDNIADIKYQIKEQTKLVNDYREDFKKTQQNISAFKLFKAFDIQVCPECGKSLSLHDDHSFKCPLCKEEKDDKKTDTEYIEKNMSYLAYLKDSLNDCIEVLELKQSELKIMNETEKQLVSEINLIENGINDKLNSMKLPIVDAKIAVKSEISQKEQLLKETKSNIEVLEKFKKEDLKLDEIKAQIKKLTGDISKIEHDEEDLKKEKELMFLFKTNLSKFFNNTNYPFFEKVDVDEKFGIDVTTSKDGARKISQISSASDKIILRLGLFYSLFRTSIEVEQINHPRMLLLDSPRDQELKWERFCESLLRFKELFDNVNQGQIFITVVVDGKNMFEGQYEILNKFVFMNLGNKENERLLRKPVILNTKDDK